MLRMDHSAHPALLNTNDGVIDPEPRHFSIYEFYLTPDKGCFQIQSSLRGVDLEMVAEILKYCYNSKNKVERPENLRRLVVATTLMKI
jgi:hypothetical protein